MAGKEPLTDPGTQASKGFGKWFGLGLNAYFGLSSYMEHREQGEGRLSSAAHGAFDLVLPEFLGWKMMAGLWAAEAVPSMLVSGAQKISQMGREYERAVRDQSPFRTNTFVDSQQIYTMRQAGMALAEQSKYALQQTLIGNEARYMHR